MVLGAELGGCVMQVKRAVRQNPTAVRYLVVNGAMRRLPFLTDSTCAWMTFGCGCDCGCCGGDGGGGWVDCAMLLSLLCCADAVSCALSCSGRGREVDSDWLVGIGFRALAGLAATHKQMSDTMACDALVFIQEDA